MNSKPRPLAINDRVQEGGDEGPEGFLVAFAERGYAFVAFQGEEGIRKVSLHRIHYVPSTLDIEEYTGGRWIVGADLGRRPKPWDED